MLSFIVRRVLAMIPTLFIVSFVTFVIIQLPPGDFATTLAANAAASGSSASQATIDAIRSQYGLNEPFLTQYFKWLTGFARGDFGYSFEWQRPVNELIADRLLLTLMLSLMSLTIMWCIAVPLGIYSARRPYSIGDHILTFVSFLGLSVPDFLLGLIYLFLGIFVFGVSVTGLMSSEFESQPWSFGKFANVLVHLLPPAFILALGGIAQLNRILRGSLIETLRLPFVTVARAKGLPEKMVVYKHALKVAINPLISVMGMQLPQLISGATVLGIVLSLPTTGPMFVRALLSQDMYLAGTFLLMLALMLMIGNLLADLALAMADPRIRLE